MKKTRPEKIRSLADLTLEKERLRNEALRIELKFSKQMKRTRILFTPKNLFRDFRSQIINSLSGKIRKMFL